MLCLLTIITRLLLGWCVLHAGVGQAGLGHRYIVVARRLLRHELLVDDSDVFIGHLHQGIAGYAWLLCVDDVLSILAVTDVFLRERWLRQSPPLIINRSIMSIIIRILSSL